MTNAPSEPPKHCLRCKSVDLVTLDSSDGISFFECPQCRRQYAQKPGQALTFRWLHPISLYLYPVIFKSDPLQYLEQIKGAFAPGPYPTPQSREKDRLALQEILLELDDPTQPLRDMLGCRASEEELREYLRCVADLLKKRLDAAE